MTGLGSGLCGEHFVAGRAERGTGEVFAAGDPHSGQALEPQYAEASADQIDRACAAAEAAKLPFLATEPALRAKLLRTIADGLVALGDELVQRVMAETALPQARVLNERGRTCNQLQQFAALVEVLQNGFYLTHFRLQHRRGALFQRAVLPAPSLP